MNRVPYSPNNTKQSNRFLVKHVHGLNTPCHRAPASCSVNSFTIPARAHLLVFSGSAIANSPSPKPPKTLVFSHPAAASFHRPQMRLPLRGALVADVSARLRRGLSTAASRPRWAIIAGWRPQLVNSASHRATLHLAEPPCFSELLVPEHHINPLPRINSDPLSVGIFGGMVCATSGDGLLLLEFRDGPATPAFVAKLRAARESGADRVSFNRDDIDPDITRLVCNPLSGEVFRLPDIDGTKKVRAHHAKGILTQSVRGHGPPDRYAVVELSMEGEGNFFMRRFFSETRMWDKLVVLTSPLPRPRRINMDLEVVAFAGRLWWVDLTWGAVSADPFSDRPELSFVELPRASVRPLAGPGKNEIPVQGMHRRMGVCEGKLRYIEVSNKEPFVLSSYTLDDDGDGWTLEHQVALSPLLADAGTQKGTPQIGVVDPLNAHVVYVIYGKHALAVDMDMRKVLTSSLMKAVPETPLEAACLSASLKACVLPPWLGTTRIPSAGTLSRNKNNAKSNTLSDILVRADRDKEN